MPDGNDRDNEPTPYRQGMGKQSWEQRFRDIQQELSHMKKAVKGRSPVSMDALVQQTESLFTAGVLHFPLPAKFRMPQIEMFDGTKDPINHSIHIRIRWRCTDIRTPYDAKPSL